MIWILLGALIIGALFLSAFYSGAETGLYCANRVRLHLSAQQKDPRGLRLAALMTDERSVLIATLVGVNVMDFTATYAVAYLFNDVMKLSNRQVELYTVSIVAPTIFVFATVLPKNLFQLFADRLMLAGSGLLWLSDRVFRLTGAVWCLGGISRWVDRMTADPASDISAFDPRMRVAVLLQESLAGRAHSSDQSELIDRVLQLSEMSLQSVMISAGRVTTIPASANRMELVRIAKLTTYTRIPVHGSQRRQIIGVINVDHVLASEGWHTVGERAEPMLRLGPYDTVAHALARLQQGNHKMAVVVEGQGPMLGIVTLRTLLELVVGGLSIGD